MYEVEYSQMERILVYVFSFLGLEDITCVKIS